jgi:hypothetical protein
MKNLVRLVEIPTGRELGRITPPPVEGRFHAGVHAFSPDGRLVALSGGSAKTVHLIELAVGKERCVLDAHTDPVSRLAFSPDGRTLATACEAGVVRLWDVATGKELGALTGRDGAVWSLAFAPDGKTLAVGGKDTTIVIWDVVARARRAGAKVPTLTPEELQALWSDLSSDDAVRAGGAIEKLTASPKQVAAFLKARLHPVEAADPRTVARHLADLDSDDFTVRDQATKELEKLGVRAEAALRRALDSKPSLEKMRRLKSLLEKLADPLVSPDNLRLCRTLEVLEALDRVDARPILEALAKGADAWLTREAKASLERLAKRAAEREKTPE